MLTTEDYHLAWAEQLLCHREQTEQNELPNLERKAEALLNNG